MRYAVIDVGTNNVLFLIAELSAGGITVLHRSAEITALGKFMKNNKLTANAIKRTRKVLHENISFARLFTGNIIVVGTSCSREAENTYLLSDWLMRKYSLDYKIISGDEEAELIALANICEFSEFDDLIIFDVGGGSTEFVDTGERSIKNCLSLPLGIRRLENTFGNDFEKKREAVKSLLRSLPFKRKLKQVLVGVGGTATALSAYNLGLKLYNGNLVHKSKLTINQVSAMMAKFLTLNYQEISHLIPFDKKRSDIIATGAMIIYEILNHFRADGFLVSDQGLQFGILRLPESEISRRFLNHKESKC